MFKCSKLCLLVVILSYTILSTIAEDVCVKKSSCICEFSNGTGIDLTPTDKSSFFSAQTFRNNDNGTLYELFTYFYHPCFDIKLTPNNTADITTNTCTTELTLCRSVTTAKMNSTTKAWTWSTGVYDYMGSTNYSQFSANGNAIIYNNGPSSTIVLLVCAETVDTLHVSSLDDPSKIVLAFYSPSACLKQIESVRSLGSTLLIIFFSTVIFYLVLGICTKKFLMGATGIEVIPNLAFWSDLPNLVKDGWAFMINGFKLPARGAGPVTSPDPNSYDSI